MKLTFPVVLFVLLIGLIISIGCWSYEVIEQFAIPDPWLYSFLSGLFHTFSNPNLLPIALWSLAKGFGFSFILLFILNELDDADHSQTIIRGARVLSSKELSRKTRSNAGKHAPKQVTVAGVPMPHECEPMHLLLCGSTSSGKTTATDEIIACAIERGDRLIIVDPNGHALAKFGKKGDTVLNPFDKRSPGWCVFNEFRKPYDFELFAKSVIPGSADSDLQQWHGYAQQVFCETARALAQTGETTTERLLYLLVHAPTEELKSLLNGSAATGLFEPGAEKVLASTKFILTNQISAFQYLRPGDFSLRSWLQSNDGNLFLTWREDMLPAVRPLVSMWIDILIASILTLPTEHPRPLWLVLDELASLEQLNSLESGLTKGRKHGLRIIAGVQSMSQLDSIYGVHNAKTLRSCFRNLLALGCSAADPQTAKEIADALGQCEIERIQKTHSESKGARSTTTTKQRSLELAVLPSEVMALPPLYGFLKFAGNFPIGKIRLTPKDYPSLVKPFVER